MKTIKPLLIAAAMLLAAYSDAKAAETEKSDTLKKINLSINETASERTDFILLETAMVEIEIPKQLGTPARIDIVPPLYRNIYAQPYSLNKNVYVNKGRLWANTGVLIGAFVGAITVLELLPEESTNWSRAEIRSTPPLKRWENHIKEGPEWDGDKWQFNFILHPYAGAAYFMSARSCGLNFWRSMLYSAAISTIGWEFGVESVMERPSIQDIVITPGIGSIVGEGFYQIKRHIVANNYTLLGSSVLGNVVAFIVDPLNEFLNFFRGSDTRRMHLGEKKKNSRRFDSYCVPTSMGGKPGVALMVSF